MTLICETYMYENQLNPGLIYHLTNEPRIKVHDLSRIALHCMIHAFCILRYISVVPYRHRALLWVLWY